MPFMSKMISNPYSNAAANQELTEGILRQALC